MRREAVHEADAPRQSVGAEAIDETDVLLFQSTRTKAQGARGPLLREASSFAEREAARGPGRSELRREAVVEAVTGADRETKVEADAEASKTVLEAIVEADGEAVNNTVA